MPDITPAKSADINKQLNRSVGFPIQESNRAIFSSWHSFSSLRSLGTFFIFNNVYVVKTIKVWYGKLYYRCYGFHVNQLFKKDNSIINSSFAEMLKNLVMLFGLPI